MTKSHKYILGIILLAFFAACTSNVPDQLKPKPKALGKMNDVVVVTDESLWNGAVGDSVRYYFESAFPVLPRPEPVFDLRHFTIEEINAEILREQLRTYLIVGVLDDKNSEVANFIRKDLQEERINKAYSTEQLRTSIGSNKWATGQILIYLFAPSEDELLNSISAYYPSIARRINEHDENSLESSIYAAGENKGLTQKVKDEIGLDLRVPLDFIEAKFQPEEDFIWFRKDTKESSISIVIQKIDYNDPSQFSKEYAKALRDVYGRKFVYTDTDNSYMKTNDEDLPLFEYIHKGENIYKREYRGIWEMTEDFMGGPFVSYLILDEANGDLYFCDGWVFGPGQKKRNLIQQLDFIFQNAKPVN